MRERITRALECEAISSALITDGERVPEGSLSLSIAGEGKF